jgi:DNA-binding CsgD family transcriptional regulator
VVAPVVASDRDLRALAAIVSEDRLDLPDGEGLPPSLLADLMGQIRCDVISLDLGESGWKAYSLLQAIPALSDDELKAFEDLDPALWEHWWACRWDCQSCTYPERTGDLRSVVKPSDFYSARQWHSTGMYCDYHRPHGLEHELQLCLPDPAGLSAGPGRNVRLYLYRGPGPDFSKRDRAVLTLLRPHLHQAYLDAERRRHPVPRLTPRQTGLLQLVAAGHTNAQIARRLGISEGTVRTWKTSTNDCTSPAAPLPLPMPSPTGLRRAHGRPSPADCELFTCHHRDGKPYSAEVQQRSLPPHEVAHPRRQVPRAASRARSAWRAPERGETASIWTPHARPVCLGLGERHAGLDRYLRKLGEAR